MVAMRNACSIQHLKHPYFWCLPPNFAVSDDVSKGLSVVELNEIYVPFWLKPTRFLNRIFIPIEDIFMHWYCMVVEFGEKTIYHLDSFPDVNMVSDREQLMERVLEMLYAMMFSPAFGPMRQYTPEDMGRWPIRRENEIPNCNTSDSSAAWVIQWLHPEGSFNPYEISGVLEDSTLRGRTAVSLAGGPFNAIGDLVRMWAAQ
ncbi:hypothetical protein S83_065672 [Arachis hypogaea]